MRIIQAYDNGNSQAERLTQALQDLGGEVLQLTPDSQSIESFLAANPNADAIHWYNAAAVASRLSEIVDSGGAGSGAFIHYDTSEIRTREEAVRKNPFPHLDESFDDEAVTDRLQLLSHYFHACIVKDPEAAEYAAKHHGRVYIVPYAIDLRTIGPVAPSGRAKARPLIVHPRTGPHKGSDSVEYVIHRLRNDGYQFDYEPIENVSHAEALDAMRRADIVIDQLLHGAYGIVSVEAMALGKPVLSHIREDLKHAYDPELPVVSANPATLYRRLVELLDNAELREQLGRDGRAYVERQHHIDAVIQRLIGVYEAEGIQVPQIQPAQPVKQVKQSRPTRKRSLQPNRFYVKQKNKRKSETYFSFDLSKLPSSSITKAYIRLPVTVEKQKRIAVHLIRRKWNVEQAKKSAPAVSLKSCFTVRAKKKRRTYLWKCTKIVKRWHRKNNKNHGVRISVCLKKKPQLIVKYRPK